LRLLDSAELSELGRHEPVPTLNALVAALGLGDAGAPVQRWGFITNGVVSEAPTGLGVSVCYGSVTLATFEVGVVAADERRAGLLSGADEA